MRQTIMSYDNYFYPVIAVTKTVTANVSMQYYEYSFDYLKFIILEFQYKLYTILDVS